MLLYSFAGNYLGKQTDQRADLSGYSDLNQASDWAREALSWAVGTGIMGSSSSDRLTLSPQKSASRRRWPPCSGHSPKRWPEIV